MLALELADLVTIDSDFDVSVTDFEHAETDLAIVDELPKVPSAEAIVTWHHRRCF